MISEMFFHDKEIDQSSNSYLFSDDFLIYFVSKKIMENGPSSSCEIYEWIINITSVSKLKYSHYARFLLNFRKIDNLFYLKQRQEEILKKTAKADSLLLILSQYTQEKVYKVLNENIGYLNYNIGEVLPYFLEILKRNEIKPQEYYLSIFFNNLIHYEENYLKLDKCVALIEDDYKKMTIDLIVSDKIIVDILFANGITTVKEMTELSVDSLVVIFSKNIDYFISVLSTLHDDFLQNLKKIATGVVEQLNEKEKEIIVLRNGLNGHKKMVLEEIGNNLGMTRERVRQIEKKAMKKITSNIYLINTIFGSIYFNLIKPNEKCITKEQLKSFIDDENLDDFILLMMSQSESCIKYDAKLEILYNQKVVSLDEIENKVISAFGDCLLVSDFDTLDEFERKVVQRNYRKVNSNIYLRKGVFERKLITDVVDDLFPNGYHISDGDALNKIKGEYKRRYNYWNDELNSRVISTYIERENYCQIDIGTYKNRKYVVSINQLLKDRINSYIFENQPTVFYESIYKHFESELIKIGVDNSYYLKGLIDADLPLEFNTKRNYIQVGESKMTSGETIVAFMKSFDRVFTFEEVKRRFEGIKDYIINNWLYSEIDEGLIWLSTKRYIYIEKADISRETIQKLDRFISGLFSSLNTKVMSSRKVFSRMLLTDVSLLDDLKIIDNQFSMFSLLKNLFKDKYFFNRPLIAIDKDSASDQENVVREYVSKLDKFDLNIIKAYQTKLSLRGLYSYLEFMEDMSGDYTQINVDTMVKKELLGVTAEFIKEFGEMFELVFSKYELVDTRKFNGYILLPRLAYNWNKYLLVGVIRTYFNDIYEVENTDIFYNSTDFIIRKIN